MSLLRLLLCAAMLGTSLGAPVANVFPKTKQNERIAEVRARVGPGLSRELSSLGFAMGNQVFIRIFKEEREFELWLKPVGSATFVHWKTWPIAAMSGLLGPKLKEGDLQAPEGFYSVSAKAMNPESRFHLSFNIGYPNAFDRTHGRTGGLIMVHGNKVSIGCFAMTDPVIEEIYLLAEAALNHGQGEFCVHVFPFRMTDERMALAADSPWRSFWQDLRAGYENFEVSRVPPVMRVEAGRYQ